MNSNKIRITVLIAIAAIVMIIVLVILYMVNPNKRAGIFWLGLPSEFSELKIGNEAILQYPRTWVGFHTPDGNHGDGDVVAVIGVPGRGLPKVVLAHKIIVGGDAEAVAAWGDERIGKNLSYQSLELNQHKTTNYNGLLRRYIFVEETYFGLSKYLCLDWYVFYNDTGYDLSLCSNEDEWEDVEGVFYKIIDSFYVVDYH